MNKLILCEGKTDAVLLSYYLEKTCGWTHRNAPRHLAVKTDETKNESGYWYHKEGADLLICGVGGKDNFGAFFKDKILPAIINSSAFDRFAVITDKDDREFVSIRDSFQSIFQPVITNAENNAWIRNTYTNGFGQEKALDFLMLAIPPDKEGALEDLLLDAISENPYDKTIVEQCKAFVNGIEPQASKYIRGARLKKKAYWGVTWTIQYPERVFTLIDEQIRSVKWEKSIVLEQCFCELMKI